MILSQSCMYFVCGNVRFGEAVLDQVNVSDVISIEKVVNQGRSYHLGLGYFFGLGLFSDTFEDIVIDFER